MIEGADRLSFQGDGQTPLQPDDLEGLVPDWVSTRGDLDEVEQRNIADARRRWFARSTNLARTLDDSALRDLHRDMFGDVWRWAGHYRPRETSVGIDPTRIASEVRKLCGNAAAWFESAPDDRSQREALARFHHRLVSIHPFLNGNGRHARLATDLLARDLAQAVPTWGEALPDTERIATYLDALRTADRDANDLEPLITFMWS